MRLMNEQEEKEILNYLKENYDVKKIPGKLIRMGEERIFLFTGNASDEEIRKIENIVPVERTGFYFARIIREEFKLSIEGSQILKDEISKNIFELTREQAEEWMKGSELNIKTGKRGFLIMKYGEDFLGCGKASEEKIGNFIPKTRRLKNKME